ncbi:MAG TPA: 16S rRNA (cytosine(967)-C(5))-methyltransferase RsmB [Candidatus Baltobacteraceae bacterium]|jgi:16S rRNA (cytosine967-C5)-methyltransferase
MNAREVALAVLRDVFPAEPASTERAAQESLDYRLRKSDLSDRDRAFATELAYGSIKMRRTLDWYLRPYTGERDKPLPPAIAEIVRLGVYEFVFTSAQEHATTNELVRLAKRYGHRGTAGLVNAVLRTFLRDKPPAPVREDFESDDDFLGVAYSFPTWIVRQWRALFGDGALEAILAGCNAPAQTAVAVNRAKTTREELRQWFEERGAVATLSPFAEDMLVVNDAALARSGERTAAGAWWVQSESSGMPVDILNPQPGEAVLDVCSGRGSKALQSAGRLGGEGTLTCVERDARKSATLERRLTEAGFAAAVITGDATEVELDGRFDRILIDAPCSGVGVLGRHPEARWRKRPDDGERLARTQRAMLERLAPKLQEGGALVYAVCSTDPHETTDVIETVLQTHNVRRGLIPARYETFQNSSGDVVVPPGLDGRDGFFISRLEKRA